MLILLLPLSFVRKGLSARETVRLGRQDEEGGISSRKQGRNCR